MLKACIRTGGRNPSSYLVLIIKSRTDRKIGNRGRTITLRQHEILDLIIKNNRITKPELAEKLGINTSAVDKHIKLLKEKGVLQRVGPGYGGYWEVIEAGE